MKTFPVNSTVLWLAFTHLNTMTCQWETSRDKQQATAVYRAFPSFVNISQYNVYLYPEANGSLDSMGTQVNYRMTLTIFFCVGGGGWSNLKYI